MATSTGDDRDDHPCQINLFDRGMSASTSSSLSNICKMSGRISYHPIIPVKYQPTIRVKYQVEYQQHHDEVSQGFSHQVEYQQHHEVSHTSPKTIENHLPENSHMKKQGKHGEAEGAPFSSRKDRGCGGSAWERHFLPESTTRNEPLGRLRLPNKSLFCGEKTIKGL